MRRSALFSIYNLWALRTGSVSGIDWYSSCDRPFRRRSLQDLNANGSRYSMNELVLRYVTLYFTSANVQKELHTNTYRNGLSYPSTSKRSCVVFDETLVLTKTDGRYLCQKT